MAGGKPEPPASGFQGGEPETRKTQPQPSPAELGSQSPSCPNPPPPPAPGQPLVPRTPAEAASGRKAAMEEHRSRLCSLALLPNPPMRGST